MSGSSLNFKAMRQQYSFESILQMLNINNLKATHDKLSGVCPVCKRNSFKVTPSKNLCNCFTPGCPAHGDQIGLVAAVKGYEGASGMRQAADDIVQHFGPAPGAQKRTVVITARNSSPEPRPEKAEAMPPLDYLKYSQEVEGLGLSQETCTAWEAGYADKGGMRGRFAIPLKAKDGGYIRNATGHIQYVGVAVAKEQSPYLHTVNSFDPSGVIFGADRVQSGELYLVADPLQVLLAYQNGVENVVSFLGPITAQNLEQLASLMDEKKCDTIELH